MLVELMLGAAVGEDAREIYDDFRYCAGAGLIRFWPSEGIVPPIVAGFSLGGV